MSGMSNRSLSPGPVGTLAIRVVGAGLFVVCIVLALRYPVTPLGLALGLVALATTQLRWPLAWLFALPALLPVLDLAPWSGRIYLEEFDLLLLATAGVAMLAGCYRFGMPGRGGLALAVILLALVLTHAIGLGIALWPPPPLDANSFTSYLSPYNGLRHAKPFMLVLLLLPALAHALNEAPDRAPRVFAWGCAAGLAALGLVAMWERGVFSALAGGAHPRALLGALFDYTGSYRITGLFHDMHTGGEAIDGYLALSWPAALWLLFSARGRWPAALAAGALALGLYALTVTFSRVDYFALVVGLLAMAVAAASMRSARRVHAAMISEGLMLATPLALLVLAGVLAVAVRTGGMLVLLLVLGAGLLAIVAAVLRPRWGWPTTATLLGLALVIIAGLAVHGLATSQWVKHGMATSLALGIGLVTCAGGSGLVLGQYLAARLSHRQIAALLLLAVIGVGAVYPALFGYRMTQRTAALQADMDVRLEHWRKVLDLRGDGLREQLFGEGMGRFPSAYLWRYSRGEIGVHAFDTNSGRPVLVLGTGGDMNLAQRLSLEPGRDYLLRVTARPRAKDAVLVAQLCRRHLLQFEHWNPECTAKLKLFGRPDGAAQTVRMRIRWPVKADGIPEWVKPATVLQLSNQSSLATGIDGGIEVLRISLLDPVGQERVANGDFSAGADRWLAYYDFHHLEWHMKNLWVHMAFDQGYFGVAALLALFALGLGRSLGAARAGEGQGVYLCGAGAAILAIGLSSTLMDVTRVAWMLYFTLILASLSGPRRPAPAGERLASRRRRSRGQRSGSGQDDL